MYPQKIFSRFSWRKIMASRFSDKLFILRRVIWALFKIPVIVAPLALLVYVSHSMVTLFAKIIVNVGKIIKHMADRDVVLRLMWTGLTTRPQYPETRYLQLVYTKQSRKNKMR